jgi:hypothetical protein
LTAAWKLPITQNNILRRVIFIGLPVASRMIRNFSRRKECKNLRTEQCNHLAI